jgi:DNA-directed RNA polymerase specialized sigma24 family protein
MPSEPSASWNLHDRALQQLLRRLDHDASVAGEKYEHLRRALVRMFDWRGASAPDRCADETIDRVARKLDSGVEIADVVAFAHGVARLVMLEQTRRPEAREVSLDEAVGIPQPPPRRDLSDEDRLSCLEQCLDELSADARSLILRYYGETLRQRIDARAALARDLGLSPNALRSRAQRIRDRLERCVTACARARRSESL